MILPIWWRWKRFAWYEWVPKDRFDLVKYVSPLLLDKFELLISELERRHRKRVRIIVNDWYWGGAFTNRGIRTRLGNIVAGGKKGSHHLFGGAGDYHSPDLPTHLIYPAAKRIFPGVILYENRGFLHSDIRNGPDYHVIKG